MSRRATVTITVHGTHGEGDHLRAIPCRYRRGPLAVTPRLDNTYRPIPRAYNVTHLLSGCTVNTWPLDSIAEATDVVNALCDSTEWSRCFGYDDPLGAAGEKAMAFGRAVHLVLEDARLAQIRRSRGGRRTAA